MPAMRGKFQRLIFWLIAAIMLGSCQTDLVDLSESSVALAPASDGAEMQAAPPVYSPDTIYARWLASTWSVITPEDGGMVALLNSNLLIPPGAVEDTVRVGWRLSSETPNGLTDPLPRMHELSPHGMSFRAPIHMFLSFVDAGLDNRDPSNYRCYYYNEEEKTWEQQPTGVDIINGRFIVTLTHFSRYAFGR